MLNISLTNMLEKTFGDYTSLPLSCLVDNTYIHVADFVEEIIAMYNKMDKKSDRIDINFDSGTLSKWNVFFDTLNITLYRSGWELEKVYSSNYSYTEFDDHRNFWIDLYYSPESYDSDFVFKDILREMNNFINRDFKEYLDNECE